MKKLRAERIMIPARLEPILGLIFLMIVRDGTSLAPADLVAVEEGVKHDCDIHLE